MLTRPVASGTSKKLPNVYKSSPNMLKMKDFDTITKIVYECGQFGLNNCCQRLSKVTQSAINDPI